MGTHIRLERQRDVVYPAYLVYAGDRAVCWIEQPAGRRNGWSVHLCRATPGDADAELQWHYRFAAAKRYALSLCDL